MTYLESNILIKNACRRQGITEKKLIQYLYMAETTYYKRLKKPGKFTVLDLVRIARKTNLNKEQRAELFETLYKELYDAD